MTFRAGSPKPGTSSDRELEVGISRAGGLEAGRGEVGRRGIVSDPWVHESVIADVTTTAREVGLTAAGLVPSPIEGATGNREFLLHLRES